MPETCTQCTAAFDITSDDLAFYEKVSPVFNGKKEIILPPTLCPECRAQRRCAFRNERQLYRRACDLTGKNMISFYPPSSPYKVYDRDAWWGDGWDGTSFGREWDAGRPFFDQLQELKRDVPRMGMMLTYDEGSAYSSYCMMTKHCYMCTSCVVNENSYYCYQTNDSRDCMDCSSVSFCELCYSCVHCYKLYDAVFCQDCENGNGLMFCRDCRGCSDCFGCVNLVNKKHCILNRQATPEECRALRESLGSFSMLRRFQEQFRALSALLPHRASHLTNCENCTGDHLRNCRNTRHSFDAYDLEDCRYIFPLPRGAKDCQDVHYSPGSELVFNSMSAVNGHHCALLLHAWDMKHSYYCEECFNGEYLFGCIGLRHKRYCVLNTQYTEGAYHALVPRIIEQMRKDGTWGLFPDPRTATFGYDETIAQDFIPLTRNQAEQTGFLWAEHPQELPTVAKTILAAQLPERIQDIPDDILHWAVECDVTKRPFKIVKQELEFYRKMRLPVPRFHPDERHQRRMALRNPRKLWKRNCLKCGREMETTYAPGRPEVVYCEECYLKEVY